MKSVEVENCRRCGRKLKSADSILKGFGPICYQKHLEENERSKQLNMNATLSNEYVLIDLERTITYGIIHYWKQSKFGYTRDIDEAGKFDYETSKSIVNDDVENFTHMISNEKIKEII